MVDINSRQKKRGYRSRIENRRRNLLNSVDQAFPETFVNDFTKGDADFIFEDILRSFLAHQDGDDLLLDTSFASAYDASKQNSLSNHHSASQPVKKPRKYEFTEISPEKLEHIRLLLEEKNYRALKRESKADPIQVANALYLLLNQKISYSLCSHIPPDKLDDYIQYAFTRFIETANKRNGWSGEGSVQAWLVRVAKNAFIEHQRSKEWPFSDYDTGDRGSNNEDIQAWEDRIALRDGDYAWVENGLMGDRESLEHSINVRMTYAHVIENLTPEQKQILRLLYDDYRPNEIAGLMHIPLTRIQTIQRTIQKIFRQALNGEDISHLINQDQQL